MYVRMSEEKEKASPSPPSQGGGRGVEITMDQVYMTLLMGEAL